MKPVRALAAASILLIIVCVVHQTGNGQTQRPNILLIVSDDLGYADIGIHGSRDIPTPNIDRVAQEGIRFTNAYVSGPYCSPTRAGLMTGRYPQRFGYEFNPDRSPVLRVIANREDDRHAFDREADHLKRLDPRAESPVAPRLGRCAGGAPGSFARFHRW